MDSSNLDTRLPPRKRLLVGLRKESFKFDFPLPVPSSDLYAGLRDLLNSTSSSAQEIIESSNTAALAAAEFAARARASANEKAAAAAKARSSAKSALELLNSTVKNDAWKDGCPAKTKSRKKHVQIKLLYKGDQPVEVRETDEELARRLHRAMNSSSRISNGSHKKNGTSSKAAVSEESIVCDGNSAVFCDGEVQLVGKVQEDVLVCSKTDHSERKRGCSYVEKHHQGSKDGGNAGVKRAKVKVKKLPLSQCSIKEWEAPKTKALNGDPKLDCSGKDMLLDDAKPSSEAEVSMKITSVWKCNKLKVTQHSSDSKIMHSLHPNPSATKSPAMDKDD